MRSLMYLPTGKPVIFSKKGLITDLDKILAIASKFNTVETFIHWMQTISENEPTHPFIERNDIECPIYLEEFEIIEIED